MALLLSSFSIFYLLILTNHLLCNGQNATSPPSNQPSILPSDQPSLEPSSIPSNIPSTFPSNQPSNLPSIQPSDLPSTIPSLIPSNMPTKMPSFTVCNESSLVLDWIELFSSSSPQDVITSTITATESVDANDKITIMVTVTSDYLVLAEHSGLTLGLTQKQFGVTYVLDTYNIDNDNFEITDANMCENRLSSTFSDTNLHFTNDLWTYTLIPSNNTLLGNDNYLEYPNPNIWELSIVDPINDPCGLIEWKTLFTFDQLRNDCGFIWEDNQLSYDLVGSIYLSIISPNPQYLKDTPPEETGEYLIKSLITYPITISFTKASTLINDAQVDQFGTSAIIVSTTSNVDQNSQFEYFTLNFITYVPYFLKLDKNSTNLQLLTPTLMQLNMLQQQNNNSLIFTLIEINEIFDNYQTINCWVLDEYRCWQQWEINIYLDETTPCSANTDDEFTLEINNDFILQTDFICIDDSQGACTAFTTGLNDYEQSLITLDAVSLTYSQLCSQIDIELSFNGIINFYQDNTFTTIRDTSNNPYSSDGEIVYVEVVINSIDTGYDVLGIKIVDITLCTADITDGNSLPMDGCKDTSGIIDQNLIYTIFNDNNLEFNLISNDTTDGNERFSFRIPVVADNTFFITVDTELTLNLQNGRRIRRRVLLQNNGDEFSEFSRVSGSLNTDYSDDSNDNDENNKNNDGLGDWMIIFIILAVAILVLIIALIMVVLYVVKKDKGVSNVDTAVGLNYKTTNKDTVNGGLERVPSGAASPNDSDGEYIAP